MLGRKKKEKKKEEEKERKKKKEKEKRRKKKEKRKERIQTTSTPNKHFNFWENHSQNRKMVRRDLRKVRRHIKMKRNRGKKELGASRKDVINEESFVVVSFDLDFSFVCVGSEDVEGGEEVFSFSVSLGEEKERKINK